MNNKKCDHNKTKICMAISDGPEYRYLLECLNCGKIFPEEDKNEENNGELSN